MNDFDFLVGSWKIANDRRDPYLGEPCQWQQFPSVSRCVKLFEGAANLETIDLPTLGVAGLTLRLREAETQNWWLYWASSRDGVLQPPVVGHFADRVGAFYGDDTHEGVSVRVRYLWSDITADSARWEQAFSTDEGATWQPNWIMTFTRDHQPTHTAQPQW